MKCCVIVPVYNHQDAIGTVVGQLKTHGLRCYLINDGSSRACTETLKAIARQESRWIILINRASNGGKGAAVMDGLRQAITDGFTHALQIDADGQHNTTDISRFMKRQHDHPDRLILGKPRFDASVPKGRLYGRQFTNLWIRINTLSSAIADGMCGFRSYPLAPVKKLLESVNLGRRMDFDIEIAVRLYWAGVAIENLETDVHYPMDGISHFDLLLDNLLISGKHAQLFLGMLWRSPQLLRRHFQ
jgi:glycosyltransferase involved in cell wall biosynthesis